MLQLGLRYALFAFLATIVNLLTQRIVLNTIEGSLSFPLAICGGTATGLLVKYVLDKKWIFFDDTSGVVSNGRKFGLYTVMGIITTLIFWAMETTFWMIFGTEVAREIGAIIGLAIGYVIKYNLDRRFVFAPQKREV